MHLERLRARIFLALGLSTAGSLAYGCGKTSQPKVDAAKADAATDGRVPDAPITVRRPFLVGASLRASTTAARGDWTMVLADGGDDALLDERTRAALARVWRQDALEEHASIAAFARFALQLLAVGAPPELVAAAHRAGADEVRHARIAFALAHRYGEHELGPAPLRVDDALDIWSLADIAELTAEEGCVGETLGALLAARQAELATDPIAHAALRDIARDELRHAELAWQFVRWAVERGGDDVLAAVTAGVRRAAAGTLAAPMRTYDVDRDAWHAHGRVTCEEARAVAAEGIDGAIDVALSAFAVRS